MNMLTPEQYALERTLVDKADATMCELWADHAKGGAIPLEVFTHPDYWAVDNAMRGRVEQYELLTNTPETFVAYVGKPAEWGSESERARGYDMGGNATRGHTLTTCTGDVLGTVRLGSGWRVKSFVGSRMYQAYAHVNGREFTGRTFGEGMSVVLRETAASKRRRNV
jgi:hypothetical protein